MSQFQLHHGDCLAVLKTLPDNSVDSVVTDPPAGIGFMGKEWDHHKGGRAQWVAWMTEVATECLRVLKPGGHALVWAIPRTSHWTATAWEDAGFEVRDRVAHVFGSGFPKSKNLDGAWTGWGTALKPAMEDWWLCRKPLIGTVAENVLAHGTGALNIDASRIPTEENLNGGAYSNGKKDLSRASSHATGVNAGVFEQPTGRWPANLIHDGSDAVVGLFPQTKSGTLTPDMNVKPSSGWSGGSQADRVKSSFAANEGSAARFFYAAKASKRDRDEGLEGFVDVASRQYRAGNVHNGHGGRVPDKLSKNTHPTVKPADLMRYLCRLITPPGGTVLDPFMGSGSTGKAAILEGFNFIGIEREVEYLEIAKARIAAVEPQQLAIKL